MGTYYENDIDRSALEGMRIAVLGFGSQGRAHALNLRDSGIDVVVGLREGSASRDSAREADLAVDTPAEAVAASDLVMILVPDRVQAEVYENEVEPNLRAGGAIAFAHGYAVRFGRIRPRDDIDVIMVAPMGIGEQVRETFARGGGVPGLVAVEQDASGRAHARALAYAAANGHGRAGVLDTDFREETETDLFAEQAVLVGGSCELIRAGFDTLVEAGYSEEIAYFSCLHELKLIVDLIHRRGIAGMRASISGIADYGAATRGPRVVSAESRAEMRKMLDEIRSGAFAEELAREEAAGMPTVEEHLAAERRHPIERVGARLRGMMPWLQESG